LYNLNNLVKHTKIVAFPYLESMDSSQFAVLKFRIMSIQSTYYFDF